MFVIQRWDSKDNLRELIEREPQMPKTLYMVVEHFRNSDAVPVYRRFRDRGRMAPDGLVYVTSWVDERLERCYQVM